ncbi:branched-chain amino acid transporter AzlC [Ktedonobacter sp. SOSP1-85]|uniref:AzlC family ABC transporter permease n=1 Tax=Ktedonobacter sp. SOSP1-85 TaxID=2778367 RepID=UPI0019151C42|nr:AzlC family ABC transporter permease [Ktedonobacter sp. SOSP1-85]GHO78924.1 branched-chain amino acid transporter AzlC [Ktedonobacter sp. SOSP1-85]
MQTSRSEFFAGIKNTLPILMGTVPFGLIYGVTARSLGLSLALTQAMSSIVFAGSAQFVTVQLLAAALPAGIILLTAGIINLRHALYSASIAPYLRRLSTGWKLLLAYLLVDEVYAIAITRFQQQDESPHKHWYFLGAGLALWSTWQTGTAVGMLLGANIPANWSLDFTLPLTFIALVVPALKERVEVIVALAAGLVAVLAAHLPLNSGLLVATFTSILLGLLLESKMKKKPPLKESVEQSEHIPSTSLEERDGKELKS